MRIIAGRSKGRRLELPPAHVTRPTSDKAREALFSVLGSFLARSGRTFEDLKVLDAFAGSGALGLEATSRGVEKVTFIEQNIEAFGVLLSNIEHLGLGENAKAYRRDACKPGKPHDVYNLVFLDPPYGRGFVPPAVLALDKQEWLSADVLLVVEIAAKETPPILPGFLCIDTRVLGAACFLLFIREQENQQS